jgi:hypothetical protein
MTQQTAAKTATAILVAFTLLFCTTTAQALFGLGSTLGKAAREAIEYTARKFGVNLAEEGGKQFARQAERLIARYGDDGIRALKKGGPELLSAAARHGDDAVRICAVHGDDAARYLVKHMDEALPLWRRFGRPGTELMVRHPGLARPLLEQFGEKGLILGQKLSTPSLGRFLQLSRKSTRRIDLDSLVDGAIRYGDKFINFLWSHKWKLAAGATFYTLLKDYDEGFVLPPSDSSGENAPEQSHNFLQHLMNKLVNHTLAQYPWLPLAGIGLLFALFYPVLKLVWRILRLFKPLADRLKPPAAKTRQPERAT